MISSIQDQYKIHWVNGIYLTTHLYKRWKKWKKDEKFLDCEKDANDSVILGFWDVFRDSKYKYKK